MLYQIATGFEDIKQYSQEDIVYLISSFDSIKKRDLTFFFTDGHARSSTTSKYITKRILTNLTGASFMQPIEKVTIPI